MHYATSSYFVQLPAGGELAYARNATAAEQPFHPSVAIVLVMATLLSCLALWFATSRSRL